MLVEVRSLKISLHLGVRYKVHINWVSILPKGYKLMNPETNKIFISRDVVFHEDIFPFIVREVRVKFRLL